jgi:hypothetical protein
MLSACDFLRGYAEGHSTSLLPLELQELSRAQLGAARLLFDDFGTLNTDTLHEDAIPWKLVAASLVLQRYPDEKATQKHLREVLSRFGFIFPESVGNWPVAEQPVFSTPAGLVSGTVRRELPRIELEVANLGCASCHAGVTYDADGVPRKVLWLGLPNTSLDLDAYVDAVGGALRAVRGREGRTIAAIKELFPEVTGDELSSLHDAFESHASSSRQGGPGRADVIGQLKAHLHLKPGDSEISSISIPALGNERLRWSILVDGLMTPAGEPRFQSRSAVEAAAPARAALMVGFVSLPSLGLDPEKSSVEVESMRDVLTFLDGVDSPRFPGVIDEAAASRGAVLYARCAECHGEYVERGGHLRLRSFPNRLSVATEAGTDSARLDAVDGEFIEAVERVAPGKSIDAAETRGFVAPSLAGIWATAPYLHNGSVPTLASLMTPSERPAKFWVGGHKLDFEHMGIAGSVDSDGVLVYPAGYLPWSSPKLYDTSARGQSNRGHEKEFDGLNEADKRDLIEFLKQL